MSDVKRIKKQVVTEEEIVELKIQLSARFFDQMEKAKAAVAKERGYDVGYGEYLEECLDDLVTMVKQLEDHIVKTDYQNQLPQVKDNNKNDGKDEEAAVKEGEVPPELYGHLEENYENDPMIS
jgi:translation initiation factor IF-3